MIPSGDVQLGSPDGVVGCRAHGLSLDLALKQAWSSELDPEQTRRSLDSRVLGQDLAGIWLNASGRLIVDIISLRHDIAQRLVLVRHAPRSTLHARDWRYLVPPCVPPTAGGMHAQRGSAFCKL